MPTRPKSPGALKQWNLRLEPDVDQAVREFARVNRLKLKAAGRLLLFKGLQAAGKRGFNAEVEGYREGIRQGLADLHQQMTQAQEIAADLLERNR